MPLELRFAPEVADDLSDAYGWYEAQQSGLGEAYLLAVEACIERILQEPLRYPVAFGRFRRALARRFPYVVFFEYGQESITVLAVFHTSDNPEKWKLRLV